ncbi:MAG: hypothetical protein RR603_03030 [Kurthia sp.]
MEQKVEVIKEKLSWNGSRVMARVGQQGFLCPSCRNEDIGMYGTSAVRVYLDGHNKGIWIMPHHLIKIDD